MDCKLQLDMDLIELEASVGYGFDRIGSFSCSVARTENENIAQFLPKIAQNVAIKNKK